MSTEETHPPKRRFPARRRMLALIALGVLLFSGALLYKYFWLYHPVGSGPAGPAVPHAPFENVWSERSVLLVGLGDSITAGYGAQPLERSYFERLVRNPADEFPEMRGICLSKVLPNLRALNLSLSGSTSIENLEAILPRLEVQPAETFGVVVMTTGGNDVIHHYGRTPPREGAMYGATVEQAQPWIDNFKSRLEKTCDEIDARFPGGCSIFLANIYDPTDNVGDTINAGLPAWSDGLAVLRKYNEVIAQCAERRENVHLIDIHQTFLGHGIHSLKFWHPHYHADDPHYWYWDNLEDPNNRGYDAIRRLFLIEMARVLPERLNAAN